MPELNLEQLFAAIGRAMHEAQRAVKESELEGYLRYFRQTPAEGKVSEGEGDGEARLGAGVEGGEGGESAPITPILQRIRIPHPDGTGAHRELQVPLVSLVHHNSFNLDQVKLRMKVSASLDEASGGNMRVRVGPMREAGEAEAEAPCAGGAEHEIELIFKREAPSEGISRITQEATKLL